MTDSTASENKEAQQMHYQKNNKNSQGIQEKMAAIFFDIEKVYDKVNRDKDTRTSKEYGNTGKNVEIHQRIDQ